MSNFNLKNYQKANGNEHTSKGLSKQHVDAPNHITEKQLSKDRVDAKNVITEKQLEKTRQKEAHQTLEARLNSSKTRFEIQHRNEDTHKGNINKLEEKRIASDKTEDEKYESSSQTPKNLRWWEKNKKENDLVIASVSEQMKRISQAMLNEGDEEKDEVVESLTDDNKRFKSLNNMWNQMDEGVINEDPDNEFITKSGPNYSDMSEEEEDLELGVTKELFLADKRETMPKGLNPYTFYANVGYDPTGWRNPEELEESVIDMVVKVRPDLDGKISNENLGKPKFIGNRGYIAVRLIGDEYMPSSNNEETEMFVENSFETTDVNGTPMNIGEISINMEAGEVDEETIYNEIADFINDKHPELNITPDSISLDVNNMTASFVLSANGQPGQIDRMPEVTEDEFPVIEENAEPEMTEAEDFPITEEPRAIASNKSIVKTAANKPVKNKEEVKKK